jgi:hypothetical protein
MPEDNNSGNVPQENTEGAVPEKEVIEQVVEKPAEEPPKKDADVGEEEQKKEVDYKFPEDYEMKDEYKDSVVEFLKEKNIDQDGLDKLVTITKDHLKVATEKLVEIQKEQWQKQVEEWGKQVETDEEYGGAQFEENMKTFVRSARDRYCSKGLVELLDSSGYGNHPEIIRLLYKVGKDVSEPTFKGGGSSKDDRGSLADRLYPSMAKKQ